MDLFADGVKKNRCPCSQAWFICLGDSWAEAKVHVESYDYPFETRASFLGFDVTAHPKSGT